VQQAALQHYLQRVAAAAQSPGASRLHHYFGVVRPDCLSPGGYGRPAYIEAVRERHRRRALAELRTGVHWGAVERDRLLGSARRPREQRHCEHCARAGLPGRVEDTHHIVFECALYTDLRQLSPQLFPHPPTGSRMPIFTQLSRSGDLAAFLAGSDAATARFTSACRQRAHRRLGLPV
jgi:hypothetical protein